MGQSGDLTHGAVGCLPLDLLFTSWLLHVAHLLGAEDGCVVWETHILPGPQATRAKGERAQVTSSFSSLLLTQEIFNCSLQSITASGKHSRLGKSLWF